MKNNRSQTICMECGHHTRLVWWISTEIWKKVIPEGFRGYDFCLECFLKHAEGKHVISINDFEIFTCQESLLDDAPPLPTPTGMSATDILDEIRTSLFSFLTKNQTLRDEGFEILNKIWNPERKD